jgi:hypothetical protein
LRPEDELILAFVLAARFSDEPISLSAQLVHFVEHSGQQFARRLRADAGTLKVKNLPTLPRDLTPALLDVRANALKIHRLLLAEAIRTKCEQRSKTQKYF